MALLTQLSGFAAADPALPTYRAEYDTTVSGMHVTLTRTLTEQAGQYQLSQSGKKKRFLSNSVRMPVSR